MSVTAFLFESENPSMRLHSRAAAHHFPSIAVCQSQPNIPPPWCMSHLFRVVFVSKGWLSDINLILFGIFFLKTPEENWEM